MSLISLASSTVLSVLSVIYGTHHHVLLGIVGATVWAIVTLHVARVFRRVQRSLDETERLALKIERIERIRVLGEHELDLLALKEMVSLKNERVIWELKKSGARDRRPTVPSMNRIIDLAGFLFSEKVRDRIYTPYAEELKEDDLNARKRFKSPGARKWIKFCLYAKFAHLFVACCGSAISKRTFSALKALFGQRLIEFLEDLVQSFR